MNRCNSEWGVMASSCGSLWPNTVNTIQVRDLKNEIEAEIRQVAKDLVDLSLRLSDFEHTLIQQIVKSLKTKILFFASILLLLGSFLTVLVSRKIVWPLRVIEKTIQRITEGAFKPLPVVLGKTTKSL